LTDPNLVIQPRRRRELDKLLNHSMSIWSIKPSTEGLSTLLMTELAVRGTLR